MKQVLLGVAGIRPKMGVDETAKPGRAWAAFGKIELSQRLHHPDVDGERLLETVGEKQNAVGDLRSDAGKSCQPGTNLMNVECLEVRQVEFAIRDLPGGDQQVWSSEAHLARAQLRFAGIGQSFGGRKGMNGFVPRPGDDWSSESFAKKSIDLLDLDDLFGR